MSLVPNFDAKEIKKMFEKMAKNMDSPTDMYCLFFQSVLTGKAKDVYCALSTSQCTDYGLDKESILQVYELVPEA